MQHELIDNAHKGHWLGPEEYNIDQQLTGQVLDTRRTDLDLLSDLIYHAAKLAVAVKVGDKEAILEYSADVGNCAWFIADKNDVLKKELFHDGPIEYDPDHIELAQGFKFSTARKDSHEFVKKLLEPEEVPF